MSESHAERMDRLAQEAEQLIAAPKTETADQSQKPAEEKKGKLAKVAGAALDVAAGHPYVSGFKAALGGAKAGVESVVAGGKKVADALLPPTRPGELGNVVPGFMPGTNIAGQRTGESYQLEDVLKVAGGVLGIASAPLAAFVGYIQSAVQQAGGDTGNATQFVRKAAEQAGIDPDVAHTALHMIGAVNRIPDIIERAPLLLEASPKGHEARTQLADELTRDKSVTETAGDVAGLAAGVAAIAHGLSKGQPKTAPQTGAGGAAPAAPATPAAARAAQQGKGEAALVGKAAAAPTLERPAMPVDKNGRPVGVNSLADLKRWADYADKKRAYEDQQRGVAAKNIAATPTSAPAVAPQSLAQTGPTLAENTAGAWNTSKVGEPTRINAAPVDVSNLPASDARSGVIGQALKAREDAAISARANEPPGMFARQATPTPPDVNEPPAGMPDTRGAGILTAFKADLTPEENAARMEQARAELTAQGYAPADQMGQYGGAEPSFHVPGMTQEHAVQFGQKYGQESVIHDRNMLYTSGENAGKMRRPTGPTGYDQGATDFYSEVGGKKYQIPYDFEAAPEEMPKPGDPANAAVQGAPSLETATETPTALPMSDATTDGTSVQATDAPPAQQYVKPVQMALPEGEAAPQVQHIAEIPDITEPVIADVVAAEPKIADVAAMRTDVGKLAQEMRASGMSKTEINDAIRAHMNEQGVLSKRQAREAAQQVVDETVAAEPPKVELKPSDVDTKAVQAEIERIKTGLLSVEAKLALQQLGDSLAQFKAKWGDMFADDGTLSGNLGGPLAKSGPVIKTAAVLLNNMGRVGAAFYVMGHNTIVKFGKRMIAEFGPEIRGAIPALFEKAKDIASRYDPPDAFPGLLKMDSARRAYKAGVANAFWYNEAPEGLAKRYGNTNRLMEAGWTTEQIVRKAADTYAATSNGTDAATANITLADRAWMMMHADESSPDFRNGTSHPFTLDDKVTAGARANKILHALNQVARGEQITGAKIGPYGATAGRVEGAPAPPVVIDRWMVRLFFPGDEALNPRDGSNGRRLNKPEREYVQQAIMQIAAEQGVEPYQVQASMWHTAKFKVEATEITALAKKNNWEPQRLLDRLTEHYLNTVRPFDVLMNDRLSPAIEAAIQSGDPSVAGTMAFQARLAGAALLKDSRDLKASVQSALIEGGASPKLAKSIGNRLLQAIKDRVNSTDPEGAQFNTASMGFDIWRLFQKDKNLTHAEWVRDTAVQELNDHIDTITDAHESLRLDLRTPPSVAEVDSARTAASEAHGSLAEIVNRVDKGGLLNPAELHNATVIAAMLLEKARNAEVRNKTDYGRRGPAAIRPIGDDVLAKFSERLHNAMSEPELFSKLSTMTPPEQAAWLANMARTAALPDGAAGWWGTYKTLYIGAQLAMPHTWVKSAVSHAISFPWTTATYGLAEGLGYLKSNPGIEPGSTAVFTTTYLQSLLHSLKIIADGDMQGMKIMMEQEGDLHLPRPNPSTPLDSILNAVGGAPSFILGSIRSPAKVALRVAQQQFLAFNEAAKLVKADPSLNINVEAAQLFREPTEAMLKNANDFSDTWSFTKQYGGIVNLFKNDPARLIVTAFANIEANLILRAVESTPAAILSSEFRRQWSMGGAERDAAMSRVYLGTMMAGGFLALGFMGQLDGEGPLDPHANRMWQKAGHVPMTYRLPTGGTVKLGFLGPFAGVAAAMGDTALVLGRMDQDSVDATILGLGHALGEVATHAGITDTLARIAHAISAGMNGPEMWDFIRDKVVSLGLVTTPLRGYSAYLNDGKPLIMGGRTESAPGTIMAEFEQQWAKVKSQFMGNLLGFSPDQPLVRDPLSGKVVPVPGPLTEVPTDPVAEEITRLHSAAVGAKADIGAPKRTIGGSVTGGVGNMTEFHGVSLEPWEYDRKIQLMGEESRVMHGMTLHEALANEIKTASYRSLPKGPNGLDGPEGPKAQRLKAIYSAYEKDGEQRLLKEDKHLRWLVDTNILQQQNVSTGRQRSPKPEPDATVYPRPGQVRN